MNKDQRTVLIYLGLQRDAQYPLPTGQAGSMFCLMKRRNTSRSTWKKKKTLEGLWGDP